MKKLKLEERKFKLNLVLPWKNKTIFKVSRKYKLKKKWRFWRLFKQFFLGKKKRKFLFHKLNWMFAQRRIIWHQLSSVYGKSIKNLVYSSGQAKVLFGVRFFNVLPLLELRLNILLVRINFVAQLLDSNILIKKGSVQVNGHKSHKNYIVRIGDIISMSSGIKLNCRKVALKWRWFHWRKWKWIMHRLKRNIPMSTFKKTKQNLCVNFMEINSKINAAILLRRPLLEEILSTKKNQILTKKLLRKIYFLY